MTTRAAHDITEKLIAVLDAGVSDDAMKAIKKDVTEITCRIEDDIMYRLKEELAPQLSAWAAEMMDRTIAAILDGNERELGRYIKHLPEHWTGRSDSAYVTRPVDDFHPVIHGKLFEQSPLSIRKAIVDAHRDVLVNQRILDLEDQVKSLVLQVNKANAEKDAMWERLRVHQ